MTLQAMLAPDKLRTIVAPNFLWSADAKLSIPLHEHNTVVRRIGLPVIVVWARVVRRIGLGSIAGLVYSRDVEGSHLRRL